MPLAKSNLAPPALPLAPQQYSSDEASKFRNTLRLFFNRLVAVTNYQHRLDVEIDANTSRTITAADENALISFTNAGAVTVTLPETDTEDLPLGFSLRLDRDGPTGVTIVAEDSASIVSAGSLTGITANGAVTVTKTAQNVYKLIGDLA